MAILFVDDGGSNTSPFDTWAKAADGSNTGGLKAALADAACVAGSAVYMGHNSTTTYTALANLASQGTFASPVNIYSVTSGDETTYNPGAIETLDGSAGGKDITVSGFANVYGVTFKTGDDLEQAAASPNTTWTFTDCTLQLLSTLGTDRLFNGGTVDGICWKLFNTNIIFGHVDQGITMADGDVFEWYGGTLTGAQSQLFEVHSSRSGRTIVRGVDLSPMTTGDFLFNGFGASTDDPGFTGEIIGGKLHASPPTLVADVPAVDGVYLAMIGCGSAGIPQTQVHTSQGDTYHETSIVRSFTYDGSNKLSFKMIPNANVAFETPLRFKLCDMWMDADPTIKVHITHDINGDGSDAQNNEIWLEIERPNDTVAAYREWDRTSRMTTLGTPADLTTEAGVDGWTNGAGAYNSISVTPNSSAGVHTVWVCSAVPVAKAETIYACPNPTVT